MQGLCPGSDLTSIAFVIQEQGKSISVCYAYYFTVDGVLFLCSCWAASGGT